MAEIAEGGAASAKTLEMEQRNDALREGSSAALVGVTAKCKESGVSLQEVVHVAAACTLRRSEKSVRGKWALYVEQVVLETQ